MQEAPKVGCKLLIGLEKSRQFADSDLTCRVVLQYLAMDRQY